MNSQAPPSQDSSPLETLRKMREGLAAGNSPQPQQSVSKAEQPAVKSDLLTDIQVYALSAFLLLFPLAIIPLPWGGVEYAKGILVIGFAIITLGIELIRVSMRGKTVFLKGNLDVALLAVLLGVVLATIFSKDMGTSLFGLDQRIGSGAVSLISAVAIALVLRSEVRSKKMVYRMLTLLIVGSAIAGLVSIFSFFGLNVFGFVPGYGELFVTGRTVMTAPTIGIVYWGIVSLLGSVLLFNDEHGDGLTGFAIILSMLVNIIAIALFSINQGLPLVGIILLTHLLFLVVTVREKFTSSVYKVASAVAVLLLIALPLVLRIPAVNDGITERLAPVSQPVLASSTTWTIVASNLSDSVRNGILGSGVDTFSLYFNRYKPASDGVFDLTAANFTYGGNEVLTVLGNQGVLGVILWLIAGFIIAYQFYRDLSLNIEEKSKLTILLFDGVLLALFASSFVTFWGVTLYTLFFIVLTLKVLFDAFIHPEGAESLVFQFNMLVEKDNKSSSSSFRYGVLAVVVLVSLTLLQFVYQSVRGTVHAMRAETAIVKLSEENQDDDGNLDLSLEQQEEILTQTVGYYADAIRADDRNALYYRRQSLLLTDYIGLKVAELNTLATEIGEGNTPTEDQQADADALQNEINNAIELTVESSRQATENGPLVFSNWDVRSFVYSELIGLNLTNYADSGIASALRAVNQNPSSYINMFRLSQMYIANEDLDNANSAIASALNINPNHVPSLVLAAELSVADENLDQADTLLTRALQILEALEAEESDLYANIGNRVKEIRSASGGLDTQLENVPDEDGAPTPSEEQAEDLPIDPVIDEPEGELEAPPEEEGN